MKVYTRDRFAISTSTQAVQSIVGSDYGSEMTTNNETVIILWFLKPLKYLKTTSVEHIRI